MTRLGSTADEIRALVPDALASWRYIRENVLERGVVDQRIKELCYRYLANDPEAKDFARFHDPERAALEWADAIAHDSDRAGDELWARLHASFSDAELECEHGRLPGDKTAPCGCWAGEDMLHEADGLENR